MIRPYRAALDSMTQRNGECGEGETGRPCMDRYAALIAPVQAQPRLSGVFNRTGPLCRVRLAFANRKNGQDPFSLEKGLFLWRNDMTKLPAKELLDGTKTPETTTGEFRLAMGNLRQFLFELFGDEGTDRETARLTMGIDLTRIRADIQAVRSGLDEKVGEDDLSMVATTGDYAHLVNKPVVCGMIVMWSGSASTVPEGWALCNGKNGTPDLQDRFIVGAGREYGAGTTGGCASLSGTTGQTTLTIDQIPSHTHKVGCYLSGTFGEGIYKEGTTNAAGNTVPTKATGGGQSHSHSLSGSTVPPYYALCYIMKL